MKKTIDWNELTPACWAIAQANGCDIGVARSMVQQDIKEGVAVVRGDDELPEEFQVHWADLGGQQALEESNDGFNIWARIMQDHYKELCGLWSQKDYAGMVRLMTASTPAPLDMGE